jgi:hypothetical protein
MGKEPSGAVKALWERWRMPLLMAVIVLVLKIGLGQHLIESGHVPSTAPLHVNAISVWSGFGDVGWETYIAHFGYSGENFWVAKHPMFPGLIRVAIYEFNLNAVVAVNIIQFVALIGYLAGLQALTRLTLGKEYETSAVILGVFAPFMGAHAIFFGLPDSLGAACMWWALVNFQKQKMPLVGVWSLLAVLSRPQGVAIPAVLGVVYFGSLLWQSFKSRSWEPLTSYTQLIWLAPALLWYLWYLQITADFTGIPLAPIVGQTASARETAVNPFLRFYYNFAAWTKNPLGEDASIQTYAIFIVTWFVSVITIAKAVILKRLNLSLLLIGVISTLLPAATAMYALGRYMQFSPLILGFVLLAPRNFFAKKVTISLGIIVALLGIWLITIENFHNGWQVWP